MLVRLKANFTDSVNSYHMQRLPYAILLIWLKEILLVRLKTTIRNFIGLVKGYHMQLYWSG